MSCSLQKLLGTDLIRQNCCITKGGKKDGDKNATFTGSQLSSGSMVIGLYFANTHSEKCNEFTGKLIQFYEKMKMKKKKSEKKKNALPSSIPISSTSLSEESSKKEKTENEDENEDSRTTTSPQQLFLSSSFEIIMISFDEVEKLVYTPSSSSSSSKSLTPFLIFTGGVDESRLRQEYLIRKYEVSKTPTLILIDGPTASVINFNGTKMLEEEDPEGFNFPWILPSCTDILSSSPTLCLKEKAEDSTFLKDSSSLIKGFFFGAYWCPPCRTFLSRLIEVYNKLKEKGEKFEIIFVSSDRSEESYKKFCSQMPPTWLKLSYADKDEKQREGLTNIFNVKAIPALVIVDEKDKIITTNGRVEVIDDIECLDFPWYPKLVEELRDKHTSIMNHCLSVIYFIGDDDSEYDKAEELLLPLAQEIQESEIEEVFQPKFFIATDSELSESLRLFIELDETKSYLCFLDIPNYRYYYQSQNESTNATAIREILHKFQTNQLKFKYFQQTTSFVL